MSDDSNRLAGLQAVVGRLIQNAIDNLPATESQAAEQAKQSMQDWKSAMLRGDIDGIDRA